MRTGPLIYESSIVQVFSAWDFKESTFVALKRLMCRNRKFPSKNLLAERDKMARIDTGDDGSFSENIRESYKRHTSSLECHCDEVGGHANRQECRPTALAFKGLMDGQKLLAANALCSCIVVLSNVHARAFNKDPQAKRTIRNAIQACIGSGDVVNVVADPILINCVMIRFDILAANMRAAAGIFVSLQDAIKNCASEPDRSIIQLLSKGLVSTSQEFVDGAGERQEFDRIKNKHGVLEGASLNAYLHLRLKKAKCLQLCLEHAIQEDRKEVVERLTRGGEQVGMSPRSFSSVDRSVDDGGVRSALQISPAEMSLRELHKLFVSCKKEFVWLVTTQFELRGQLKEANDARQWATLLSDCVTGQCINPTQASIKGLILLDKLNESGDSHQAWQDAELAKEQLKTVIRIEASLRQNRRVGPIKVQYLEHALTAYKHGSEGVKELLNKDMSDFAETIKDWLSVLEKPTAQQKEIDQSVDASLQVAEKIRSLGWHELCKPLERFSAELGMHQSELMILQEGLGELFPKPKDVCIAIGAQLDRPKTCEKMKQFCPPKQHSLEKLTRQETEAAATELRAIRKHAEADAEEEASHWMKGCASTQIYEMFKTSCSLGKAGWEKQKKSARVLADSSKTEQEKEEALIEIKTEIVNLEENLKAELSNKNVTFERFFLIVLNEQISAKINDCVYTVVRFICLPHVSAVRIAIVVA